jgi:hypothetical protein
LNIKHYGKERDFQGRGFGYQQAYEGANGAAAACHLPPHYPSRRYHTEMAQATYRILQRVRL